MTIHEETIAKIRQLPEPLRLFSESIDLAELDLSDYLSNLESYEDSLLRGKIQW
jgi:hypothetical protein